ncbi:hypothetical protein XaC1_532 [Xanthomonas phage XaC1]|nr:hypothetical protein XaC1_532 [Xanthomonas phage XaC1]
MEFSISDCYNAFNNDYVSVLNRYRSRIVFEWGQYILKFNIVETIYKGYYTIKLKNDASVVYDEYGTYTNQCRFVVDFNTIIPVTDLHIKFDSESNLEVLRLNCTKDEYFNYCLYYDTPFKFEELHFFEKLYHLVQRKYFDEKS